MLQLLRRKCKYVAFNCMSRQEGRPELVGYLGLIIDASIGSNSSYLAIRRRKPLGVCRPHPTLSKLFRGLETDSKSLFTFRQKSTLLRGRFRPIPGKRQPL